MNYEQLVDEINTNPEKARKFLPKYTGMSDEIAEKVPFPIFVTYKELDGHIEAAQKFLDIFYDLGVVSKRPNANAMILTDRDLE